MKAIKIAIVTVLVAALGFGLYSIIDPFHEESDESSKGDIEIPEECDLDWAQQYIDSVYRTISNGQFQILKNRRGEMKSQFNNMMTGTPKKCQETVNLILRNRYQTRFVQMTKNEFAGKDWPHYSDIKEMNMALLNELSRGSSELKEIESVCNEYGKIVSYNARVKAQSNQRPSSIYNHWNFTNTKDLIDKAPSASSPVDHTTQYDLSKTESVKSILYKGNVSFLEALVRIANTEIGNNPTKKYYDQVCEIVTKEIEEFKNKASSIYGRASSSESKARELNNELDGFEKLIKNEQR